MPREKRLDTRDVAAEPGKYATHLTRAQIKDGWQIVKCPSCNGSGNRGNRKCGLCQGRKKIVAHK